MYGILLTDLSKAFDCISHDLLIAKLKAYGFSYKSLSLIKNYLSNRYQRTKINNTFSMWLEILYGVPQGFILGPLLFNIYICDIFLCSEGFDMANYDDDCSLYNFCGSINEVINKLQHDSRIIIDWYVSNYLKPNSDKWHLLLSYAGNDVRISIDDKEISNSSYEKILGGYFDNKLKPKTSCFSADV